MQNCFFKIGQVYISLGEFDKAVKNFQKAIDSDPELYESWYFMGLIMEFEEKWMQAAHFFKKSFELNSGDYNSALKLAQNEYKTGNVNSAEEAFQQAEILNPMDTDLYVSWSEMYLEENNFDQAISLLKSGIEELPESAILYYRLVVCFLKSGNYQKAFQYLENALLLDFEGHADLYNYFPDLEANKMLYNIINQFREGENE